MKTMISKTMKRALIVIACAIIVMSVNIPVNAAEKVMESVQSNCDCTKELIYVSLRRSECVTASYHRSYYFKQYECKHGKTSVEETELESHTMSRTDLGHVEGTIKHSYQETCSRCGFTRRVDELCYCDR